MCGIVGMAGDITRGHVKIFNDMLDVVQLRGRHSTGVVRVDRRGEYRWLKQVGTPNFLKDSHAYEEMTERGMLPEILIGHGRHKTVGETDWKSAHPFEVADHKMVGVHNGTLRGYHGWTEHKVGMTDSEALFNRIASKGITETFEEVDGAFACVWYNENEQRLYFIRNDERPLWFTYSKDKRVMFWASEPWMFGAIERRIDLWDGTKESGPYICMPTMKLYAFEVNGNAAKDKPCFTMREDRKIEKKPPKKTSSYTYGKGQQVNTTPSTTPSPSDKDKGGEVANPFLPRLPNFLSQRLSGTKEETTKSGTTPTSTEKSSTTSKNSSEQPKQSKPTKSSSKKKTSLTLPGLPRSQKTSRKKLSVVSGELQIVGSNHNQQIDGDKIYSPQVGVDTRYIHQVDTEYITDLRTGKEYDEYEFRKNTNGGKCCHCDTKVASMKDVAEIYSPDRFICNACVEPVKPVLELVKEA